MKKFFDKKELKTYISSNMLNYDNVTSIVSFDLVEDIVDVLQGYTDIVNFTKIIESDYEEYEITKHLLNKNTREFSLSIEPIQYDDDYNMVNNIENEYVLIQNGLLDDEDFDSIVAEEELEILKLEENQESNCETCPDKYECEDYIDENKLENEQLSHFDELSEDQKEYIELCVAEVLDNPMSQLKDKLAEIFVNGINEGTDMAMLALSDSLRDLVLERYQE